MDAQFVLGELFFIVHTDEFVTFEVWLGRVYASYWFGQYGGSDNTIIQRFR